MSGIKNKQLDILKAYEDSLKDPHRYDLLKLIAAPLSILLVIAITCGALFFVTSNTQKEISDINTKIGTTKAAIEATDQQSYSELKTMQEAVSAMNEINRKISNYVSMSSTKLNKIVGFCDDNGIDITSLSFTQPTETSSTSTLTLQGSAEDPDDITMFVSDLRASKLYKNIQYAGYTQSQNSVDQTGNTEATSNTGNSQKSKAITPQSETVYTFTVTMVLK